uniref:Tail fiber protein n=1 Tax=Mycena chlorophos TaxID=658473 RepID=A0ABQ0KUT8_MYCCL|nr:predicted protein [Mycena chlorophos]
MAVDPNSPVYGTNNPKRYKAVVDVDVSRPNPNDLTDRGDVAKAEVVIIGGSISSDGEIIPPSGNSLPSGTNRSAVIGTAATDLMPSNPNRVGGFIQNVSANNVGINEFADAVIGNAGTTTLAPGDTYTVRTNNAISAIADAAATNVTAIEWEASVTLVSSIIFDAYRESNIIPLAATLTDGQSAEALGLYNAILSSLFGTDVGEFYRDFPLGNFNRDIPPGERISTNEHWVNHPPINSRLIALNEEPITIDLTGRPQDGARYQIMDPFSRLPDFPVTLNGNGRLISGFGSITLDTAGLDTEWMYRADKAAWVPLTNVELTDDNPFPKKYDQMFIVLLAIRLNPRYGRALSDLSQSILKVGRTAFIAQYLNSQPLEAKDDISWPFMSRQGWGYGRQFSSSVALIARPALKRYLAVGDGPIRLVFSAPGDFSDALFVISGAEWYRVDLDGTITLLQSGIQLVSACQMAATGDIGTTPPYLFMCDGRNLYCYVENGFARGQLSGTPSDGDIVNTVNTTSMYYKFTTGDVTVDDGTADGSAAHPWLVKVGVDAVASLTNLGNAFSALGSPGTDYSTFLTANPDIQMISVDTTHVLFVRANTAGTAGNGIQTQVTASDIAWADATLINGGQPGVIGVPLPSDVGCISVGYIASYVVVIPAQGNGINGRFYWINPGETTIDPLDFATAERSPDPVYQVVVFGDQFWLPGSNTTEVWYFTGNINAPVQRLQGVTFDRGTWQGTALQVKESMIIVDSDGGVFQISGGLTRISNPSIEERIRNAILKQAYRTRTGI